MRLSRRYAGCSTREQGVWIALLIAIGVSELYCPSLAAGQNQPPSAGEPQQAPVSYFKDIRPILQRTCQGCHQPATKSGDLLLTTHEGLMAGGDKGKVVTPGQPEQSLILAYLKGDVKPQMPMGGSPLPPQQIDLFRRWIQEGAKDDTPAVARDVLKPGALPVYRDAPAITALAYSPDGKILAVSGYREILLHKADGSGLIARLPGLSDKVASLAFSPDGALLAAVGGSPASFGEFQLWDVAQRQLKRSATLTGDTLFGVSFSPDGSKLAFGGTDNAIYVYDVATGKQILKMGHHDGWVFGTIFSQDGSQIVSVGRDRAAKLSNVSEGIFIENINQLKDELNCIARQPKQDRVLIGGEDGIPYLLRMHRPRSLVIGDTSTLIREFERQDGPVISVAFSPDGQLVAVGSSAEEVRVYRTETGERVAALRGRQGGTYAVAFHPNRDELAAAGFDGTVRIYDLKSGNPAKAFVPVPLEKQVATVASPGLE